MAQGGFCAADLAGDLQLGLALSLTAVLSLPPAEYGPCRTELEFWAVLPLVEMKGQPQALLGTAISRLQ